MACLDLAYQLGGTFGNSLRCKVVNDKRTHLGARTFKGKSRVIFAVIARKNRNDDAGFRKLKLGSWAADILVGNVKAYGLYLLTCAAIGEYGFHMGFPSLLQAEKINLLVFAAQEIVGGARA